MKTKQIALLFIGLICLFITSCNQEDVIIPAPSIKAFASPEVVKYGGDVTITWNSLNSDYCTINNVTVPCHGSITYKNLIYSQKYEITAVGKIESTTFPLTVPVDKAPAPTINVGRSNLLNDTIPYGNSASFSWTTEGIITSVSIDGVTVANSGDFKTPKLTGNKEYNIIVKGPGGETSEKVLFIVGDWTKSLTGLLTYPNKPLKLKHLDYLVDGKVVGWITVNQEMGSTISIIYTIDGKILGHDDLSGKDLVPSSWELQGNTYIVINKVPKLIVSITKDVVVYSAETTYYGKPAVFRYSYSRL